VSQPAPAGGKFVVYARQNDLLEVVALNANNGSTAWVAPASPSEVTPGVAAGLAVRAATVFYLENFGTPTYGRARLVARDAASGNVVWQSAVGSFETWPEICPDQTNAVCVNGKIGSVGWGQLRFSASTGQVVTQLTSTDQNAKVKDNDIVIGDNSAMTTGTASTLSQNSGGFNVNMTNSGNNVVMQNTTNLNIFLGGQQP